MNQRIQDGTNLDISWLVVDVKCSSITLGVIPSLHGAVFSVLIVTGKSHNPIKRVLELYQNGESVHALSVHLQEGRKSALNISDLGKAQSSQPQKVVQ